MMPRVSARRRSSAVFSRSLKMPKPPSSKTEASTTCKSAFLS